MKEIKGERLYVDLGASKVRRRLISKGSAMSRLTTKNGGRKWQKGTDHKMKDAEQPIDLEAIRQHFEKDHFATSSGMRIIELQPGQARTVLHVEKRHLNSVGIVQGGAIFTLADLAFALACNCRGQVAVAVSTNLSFLKATRSGTLYADATEISRSRRLSTCTVRVTNDAGELVALFQGTAFIKDEPFPPRTAE